MSEPKRYIIAALNTGQSIHVETTLAGQGKAQLNLIERVHKRVKKGGHGVPDEVVEKRYSQSNHNLAAVAFKADNVVIYDNSQKFVSVYRRDHDQVIKNNLRNFLWINPKNYL